MIKSRSDDLFNRGIDPESDTLLNALSLVPRQSGLESTLQDLRDLSLISNTPITPVPDIEEKPAGYQVTRELPYDQGAVFNTPMEDFLKYGGRDDDSGMSLADLLRQDFDSNKSYGQTDQPATEVRFDEPMTTDPITGMSTSETSAASGMGASGFAGGGLTDILRMMYAKR